MREEFVKWLESQIQMTREAPALHYMFRRGAVAAYMQVVAELREPLIQPAVRTDQPLECMIAEGDRVTE